MHTAVCADRIKSAPINSGMPSRDWRSSYPGGKWIGAEETIQCNGPWIVHSTGCKYEVALDN